MKRFLLILGAASIIAVSTTSCAATKRDCFGAKHTRLKNGIYL
ncbi:MAG TPA: hypothetical protein VM888_06905 [Chitinophagaceae bacterium]|nr:hypothetical protein [Chitinophagaceae bacterium]